MSYIHHNAIIVTGHHDDDPNFNTTQQAHNKAVELGLLVTPITLSKANNYSSFLICPNGGGEGGDLSNEFIIKRVEFLKWVQLPPRMYLDYVHISYGGENHETVIVHEHS